MRSGWTQKHASTTLTKYAPGSSALACWRPCNWRPKRSVAPRNAALIDKHWNPVLAAWYPEGKDDPHLTLLRFDADDGRIWVSKKGPVRFMLEVAKANLTKTVPDAGGVADVNLQ